jgi:endonuclease YncB( thermonuclease family)
MATVKIKWDPKGFELDSLRDKKITRTTDGDTIFVEVSIRMLSIDAPELHYPGMTKPGKYDDKFKQLAQWIDHSNGMVSPGLAKFLKGKLSTGKAGSLHQVQGEKAHAEFQKILDSKLVKKTGNKRPVFLWAANEHFDQYGRLLAYVSPYYTKNELATMTLVDRATFNLLMVKSGWAASFPIYPSLPKKEDFELLQDAGETAFGKHFGIWKNSLTLTGYEYRMCVRLYELMEKIKAGTTVTAKEKKGWIERYCVDITTCKLYDPQDYYNVKPYNRLFIWPEDVKAAKTKLDLS